MIRTYPQIRLPILTTPITAIHTHNHCGIGTIGRSLAEEADRNTKSATVSSLAPNSLTVPVFLAMLPSIISVTPQRRYVAQNPAPNTGRNSNKTLNKMREAVMMFAMCFFIRFTIPPLSWKHYIAFFWESQQEAGNGKSVIETKSGISIVSSQTNSGTSICILLIPMLLYK